jgi:hypothetical protein
LKPTIFDPKAPNKEGVSRERRREMANPRIFEFLRDHAWEVGQTIWMLTSGAKQEKKEEGGEGSGKMKGLGWLASALHPFSDKDEVLYAQLLDTTSPEDQEKIYAFAEEIARRGWDEDVFRLRLVENFSKALEAKNLMNNSATATLNQLAGAAGRGYGAQEQIAKGKKLLVPVPGGKKFIRWAWRNKTEFFLWILFIIFFVSVGIFLIFEKLFG